MTSQTEMTSQAENRTLTTEEFTAAFRSHPGGVAVITADAGAGPVGLTATSVTSVSVDPPLLVFSVSHQSSSAPTIAASDTVVIHLLNAEDIHLAKLCATSGIDRFADTSLWSRLETGEPYFSGAGRWIRGRVVNRVEAGTSTLTIVEAWETGGTSDTAAEADASVAADALVYHSRTWHSLSEQSRLPQ